jgi:hypothetical protein
LFVRSCHSRSHVIFGCDSLGKLRNREGLAIVPIFRKSDEVCTIITSIGSMPYSRIFTYCKLSRLPNSCLQLLTPACQLPDSVKDMLSNLSRISKTGMASLHTHCRRELFQACWEILLDEEFLHAYRHGIVLRCPDGVLRRVFPRIFTYSADYPEKYIPLP